MPTLDEIAPGGSVTVTAFDAEGPVAQRLMEMGFVEGATVEVVRLAPLGDPIEVRLSGYLVSLRKHEARTIAVTTP